MANIQKQLDAITNKITKEIGLFTFEKEAPEFSSWSAKQLFDYLKENEFVQGFRESEKCIKMLDTLQVKNGRMFCKLIMACTIY